MSKKIGLILMFAGAYATLISGLTWVMNFTGINQDLVSPYEWAWGLIIAVVGFCGAAIACKNYIMGFIGLGIYAGGLVGHIILLVDYIGKFSTLNGTLHSSGEPYSYPFPVFTFIAFIVSALGFAVCLFFHIKKIIYIKNHGNSLLN